MTRTDEQRAAAEELAVYVDAQPDELFDMSRVGSPGCGTPGCLLGHARELWELWDEERDFFEDVAERLGMTEDESTRMFFPREMYAGPRVTKARAVATLRRWSETGKIWF